MDLKAKVQDLVVNGKLEKAIDLLLEWSRNKGDDDLYNDFTLLKARYNNNKRNQKLTLISNENALIQRMGISNAILEYLDEIDDAETLVTSNDNKELPVNNVVLFLASNPSNTALLQLEKEFVRISSGLQDSNHNFDLKSKFAVTPFKFQLAAMNYKPRIIHFSGHGKGIASDDYSEGSRDVGFMPEPDSGILLQDESGHSKIVKESTLEQLFEIFSEEFQLDLVILNACYSKLQAESIFKYVPHVIGMRAAVEDTTAIEFSKGFYAHLAQSNNIELSFKLAQNLIGMEGLNDEDKPVLLIRK